MAKLTLIGLSNYDEHLFDNMSVPTGIDKDILIDTILENGGEFEVLYPDIDYLKYEIGAWSRKWQHNMQRWVKLISVDYAPLDNYDRDENITETTKDVGNIKNNGTVGTTNHSDGSVEDKKSAYDADDYSDKDKSTTQSDGQTDSKTDSNTDTSNTRTFTHINRTRGNIGTMSSQNMFVQELDVLKVNMYDELSHLFLTEFVVPVY